jgi:hypothetical protein
MVSSFFQCLFDQRQHTDQRADLFSVLLAGLQGHLRGQRVALQHHGGNGRPLLRRSSQPFFQFVDLFRVHGFSSSPSFFRLVC